MCENKSVSEEAVCEMTPQQWVSFYLEAAVTALHSAYDTAREMDDCLVDEEDISSALDDVQELCNRSEGIADDID